MLSGNNKDAATKSDIKRDLRDAWDNSSDAKDHLEDAANKAGRKVRGYIDNASGEISQATDTVKSHIRSNPIQSSLVALAAGFILGRLFRL